MSAKPFQTIITEIDNKILIKHSPKRKLLESIFFVFFVALGSMAIVFGIIFNDQGLFFRIFLICIGVLISVVYLESIISIYSNRIEIDENNFSFRGMFITTKFQWIDITSLEIEKRNPRLARENITSRYILMKIRDNLDKEYLFQLFRFRSNEAELIVDLISSRYQKSCGNKPGISQANVSHLSAEELASIKPITDEEIDAQIPPKIEDFDTNDES